MIRTLVILGAAVLLVAGGVAGWFAAEELEDAETVVQTTTETATDTTTADPETEVPAAVEETRAALLEAAESGNYDALRPLLPTSGGFEYTFGGPVEGGPIAYWQQLERDTNERPLETLAAILRMPYVLTRGIYVWPWAYTVESIDDLSEHERGLLEPLGPPSRLFVEGTGYLGWRTGIAPDGSWVFFVAGD